MFAGLFAMGWVVELLRHAIRAIEGNGYRTALEDLNLLHRSDAEMQKVTIMGQHYPLASAVVTLASKRPSNS
jgi:hypothetical protein